jgi:hypothetical protein
MKLTTMALATAFALSSTAALAQGTTYGTSVARVGTVTAPSVGSYAFPTVGTTNTVPTWGNTGPSTPTPGAPTIGSAPFGSGARR